MTIEDLQPEERQLLIDLALWCHDFFDDNDGRWGRHAAAVLFKLFPEGSGECICRTVACSHIASEHTGPNGACRICQKECWS